MIAIAQHVRLAAGPPFAGVEGEAFDQVMGVAFRNGAFPHDEAEAVEGRVAGGFALERGIGEDADGGEARLAVRDAAHRTAMVLAVRYVRSEEHTSELQSLMRISYAVVCLKKKKTKQDI